MDWFSVSVACRAWFSDVAALVLESCGAKGAEIEDPELADLRVGTIEEWAGAGVRQAAPQHALDAMREVTVRGYFYAVAHDESSVLKCARGGILSAAARARAAGLDPGTLDLTVSRHDQAEWEDAWKEGFGPVRTSGRIIIMPPWLCPESGAGARPVSTAASTTGPGSVVVIIDPGMAFGTGTHPTTYMCLEMLEETVRPGFLVADIGTGSGILAIAAARLGARVIAWDSDPLAIDAARSNLKMNGPGLPVEILLHESGADENTAPHGVVGRCDLVLANIVADTLVSMRRLIASLLKPNAQAVLSGIILSKESMVIDSFTKTGFARSSRRQDGEWVALAFTKGGVRDCTGSL